MSTSEEERSRILSPEEIAAMDGDEYNPDEDNAAALAEIGRGSVGDEDASESDLAEAADEDETAAEPAEAPATEAEDEPEAEATPEAGPELLDAPLDTPALTADGYKVDLPADFDDKLKANKVARADLRKRFNDGQMDQAEYDAGIDDLDDRREELARLKTRAEIAAEMRQQSEQSAWFNTINAFFGDAAVNPELGIVDYRRDVAKQADLDAFVKALGATPGNENKPMRWYLEEGHRRVVALHSVPLTKKAPVDVRRKPDASAVVTNLADVPGGAGDADPSSSEFAEIDKLNGMEFERALASMSPDKRERYLLSA